VVNLVQLIPRLCDAEIDFVIVGGFAAMLHGSSLVTRDIDVCAVLTGDSVGRLREALRDLRPVHRITSPRQSFMDHADLDGTLKNLYLETELGPVDILSSIPGVGDFARVRAHASEISLAGRRCHIISLADLIKAKESLGRDKDLLAVRELRAIAAKQQMK
jgi:hypothetical protein